MAAETEVKAEHYDPKVLFKAAKAVYADLQQRYVPVEFELEIGANLALASVCITLVSHDLTALNNLKTHAGNGASPAEKLAYVTLQNGGPIKMESTISYAFNAIDARDKMRKLALLITSTLLLENISAQQAVEDAQMILVEKFPSHAFLLGVKQLTRQMEQGSELQLFRTFVFELSYHL